MFKTNIAIVFVLSLGVWIFFRWMTPDAPLGATETLVVVFVVGAAVSGTSLLIKRLSKKKEKAT